MSKGKKQSRYALKGQPYQYSKALRDWERAKRVGDDRAAEEASMAHEAQFGYRRRRKEQGK